MPKDLILREDFSGEKKFESNKTVSDYRYTGLYLHVGDGAADEIRRYRWRQTEWSETPDAVEDPVMRALMKKKCMIIEIPIYSVRMRRLTSPRKQHI